MANVFVSIGSNLHRERNVPAALLALQARFGSLRCSSVYETEAVGDARATPFYNLVVAFQTDCSPYVLKQIFRDIEAAQGRTRAAKLPCALDLDLLLWDDMHIDTAGMVLPRKDILQQAFVLEPMAELEPFKYYPGSLHNYCELWSAFQHAHGLKGAISKRDWRSLGALEEGLQWCFPDYTLAGAHAASA